MPDKPKVKSRISKREQKRLDLIDRWENTPSENPAYKGRASVGHVRYYLTRSKPTLRHY